MARVTPLSGFPEWLPAQRMVEQRFLDTFREVFELYGYAPVETRAVEPLEQLLRKGETSKEVYLLRRLQADPDQAEGAHDDDLGLHFDLTVPFARYVLERAGSLPFPFKRYQIQKVWRGERPQEGRYREFTQADVDVVGRGTLPFHYEVEVPLVVADAFARLPLPPVLVQVNNRKIPEGFARGLGVAEPAAVLRAIDKLDKIGAGGVHGALTSTAGCSDAQATALLSLAEISSPDPSFTDRVQALADRHGVKDDVLEEGLAELARVVEAAGEHTPGLVVADLRIARGLDYYTGTVYETSLRGHETLGSICSGGRYDDLASSAAETFPGVGISIGVTRLLGRLLGQRLVRASRQVPTCVLVALPGDAERPAADRVAAALRARGIPAEVSPDAARYGKQIRYAERRGIPYVWFPDVSEVRDIRSGEQQPADTGAWTPPPDDLTPTVLRIDSTVSKETP